MTTFLVVPESSACLQDLLPSLKISEHFFLLPNWYEGAVNQEVYHIFLNFLLRKRSN